MDSNNNDTYLIILQLFNKQEFGRLQVSQNELVSQFLERVQQQYELYYGFYSSFSDEDLCHAWEFESLKQNKIYTFNDKITMSKIVEEATQDIFVFKEDYTFGIFLKHLLLKMEVLMLETQETCSFDQILLAVQNEVDEGQSDKNPLYNTQSELPNTQAKQTQIIVTVDSNQKQLNTTSELIKEANYALSIEEYLEALRYSIKKQQSFQVQNMFFAGKTLFGLLKYKSAVTCFDYLLNILIDNLSLEQHYDVLIQKGIFNIYKGVSQSRLRKYKEALDFFEKAQKLQNIKNSFLENEISNAKQLLAKEKEPRSPQIEKKVHL